MPNTGLTITKYNINTRQRYKEHQVEMIKMFGEKWKEKFKISKLVLLIVKFCLGFFMQSKIDVNSIDEEFFRCFSQKPRFDKTQMLIQPVLFV